MARINIEDDLETHDEWYALLELVGDRDAALGKLVRFFRIAQKSYGKANPITPEALHSAKLDLMIESGWAIPVEGGYTCKGAQKHFGWYAQRVDAGKKRAESPRDSAGRFAPSAPAENQRTPAKPIETPAAHQPLTLSLAPSLTLSQKKELKAPANAGAPPDASRFIGTYVKAWQTKYGEKTRPQLTGKVQGQIKQFLKDTPLDRACDLIQVYFQIDDPWFKTKCHDFATFIENLGKVGLALDNGSLPGQVKRRTIEEILGTEAGRGHG